MYHCIKVPNSPRLLYANVLGIQSFLDFPWKFLDCSGFLNRENSQLHIFQVYLQTKKRFGASVYEMSKVYNQLSDPLPCAAAVEPGGSLIGESCVRFQACSICPRENSEDFTLQ